MGKPYYSKFECKGIVRIFEPAVMLLSTSLACPSFQAGVVHLYTTSLFSYFLIIELADYGFTD